MNMQGRTGKPHYFFRYGRWLVSENGTTKIA